jgi:hypothetical protein
LLVWTKVSFVSENMMRPAHCKRKTTPIYMPIIICYSGSTAARSLVAFLWAVAYLNSLFTHSCDLTPLRTKVRAQTSVVSRLALSCRNCAEQQLISLPVCSGTAASVRNASRGDRNRDVWQHLCEILMSDKYASPHKIVSQCNSY